MPKVLNKRKKLNNIVLVKKNKESNTYKQLKDYKVFVFDLDDTLYLHNIGSYSEEYHVKVKNFLVYLKDNNKLLYITTHNTNPIYYLDKLNITYLFDGIIKETRNVCPLKNDICEYTNKKDMIYEILNKDDNKRLTKEDVIFFDDHTYNITQVNSIGVKCILVDSLKGITFSDIY